MVRKLIFLCSCIIVFGLEAVKQKRIVVVTPSYNNRDWYRLNLDSIFQQDYNNYRLIYIDDCSSDGTFDLVKNYIAQKGMGYRVTLIHNEQRKKAMANLYYAITSCQDTDIIVILDADDLFAHSKVLQRINETYANEHIWLTYGQMCEWRFGTPQEIMAKKRRQCGGCKEFEQKTIDCNSFRQDAIWPYFPSHLRTFYAGLFKKIKKIDLMYKEEFFASTSDLAMMLPMLEMARDHFKFIPEVLVIYNMVNPLNDYKMAQLLQQECEQEIRNRARYEQIDSPF